MTILVGIVSESFDSVRIKTSTLIVSQTIDSSSSRPSAVMELMLKWRTVKSLSLSGDPFDKSMFTDCGSSSDSDMKLMSSRVSSLRRSDASSSSIM